MEIFCYVGSNNKHSVTRKICSQLLVELNQKMNANVNIYDGISSTILPVEGASSFFGQDPLDKVDDIEIMKDKLLKSQIIILGSPVYFHNVSGDMKNFIDRLCYLTHLFPFMFKKKVGVVVVCGSFKGSQDVVNYLKDFEEHLGLGSIQIIEYNSNVDSFNDLRKDITNVKRNIICTLNQEKIVYSKIQKEEYDSYLNYYSNRKENTSETVFWRQRKRLHKSKK